MNYYHAKISADQNAVALRRDAERHQLAASLEDSRPAVPALRVEISVGRLLHWRLQWGGSNRTGLRLAASEGG
jgi:hypothetical protein